MPDFVVEFEAAARRDLDQVDPDFRASLLEEIGEYLSSNPFPRGKRIKRLGGFRIPTYELRVQGAGRSHRVVYRIEGRRVFVQMIPPRKLLDRYLRRLKEDSKPPYEWETSEGTTRRTPARRQSARPSERVLSPMPMGERTNRQAPD